MDIGHWALGNGQWARSQWALGMDKKIIANAEWRIQNLKSKI
jgi:hypothetical protein